MSDCERTWLDSQRNAGTEVVFARPEPRVTLRLLENVVQESVIAVVIHVCELTGLNKR